MQEKELGGTRYVTANVTALAAGTDANLFVWRAPIKCVVTGVSITPAAAITHDGTNITTYTLTRHTAGATATTVATRAWDVNDSAANTPESMTLSATAANLILAANDTLTIVKTHAASGLATPAFGVQVSYQALGV